MKWDYFFIAQIIKLQQKLISLLIPISENIQFTLLSVVTQLAKNTDNKIWQ